MVPLTPEVRLCAPGTRNLVPSFPQPERFSMYVSPITETARLLHSQLSQMLVTLCPCCSLSALPGPAAQHPHPAAQHPAAEGIQLLSIKPRTGLFKARSSVPGSFPHWTDHLEPSTLSILLSSASPVGDDGALFLFLNIKVLFYSIFRSSLNFSNSFWQRVPQVHCCYSLICSLWNGVCGCCNPYCPMQAAPAGPRGAGDSQGCCCLSPSPSRAARGSSRCCCSPTVAWLTSGNSTTKVATS